MVDSQFKHKILIIDNNALTCSTLKSILEDLYEIVSVSCVDEAKSYIKKANPFSLILISLHLPLNEGLTYLKKLYNDGSLITCKAMMTSSTDYDEDIMDIAFKYGCCEYLHFPFVPSIVKRRIEQAIKLYEAIQLRNTDEITGALTKAAFMASIKTKGQIAYCKIISIKNYNIKYGFEKGNDLLGYVATLLKTYVKDSIVGYFGHNDFVVFTDSPDFTETLEEVSSKIKDITLDVNLSLSSGIYRMDSSTDDIESCVFKAYLAQHTLKMSDYSVYCYYNPLVYQSILNESYIVENLFEVIKNGGINIYYQSVVRTTSHKIVSKEALARWNDEQKGEIAPERFVSIFEKHKIIHVLDRYVLEKVCMDYQFIISQGLEALPTSVNLSLYDFVLCDMVGFIKETVEKYNVPKNLIEFELNTDSKSDLINEVLPALTSLSEDGFILTLDNFGRGNYSIDILSKLKNIIKAVKISIDNIEALSLSHKALIEFSVDIIKSMGFIVVAKGIENQVIASMLMHMGCDLLQGYYFDFPQNIDSYLISCSKIGTEKQSLKNYYEEISRIKLMSHKSVTDYVDLDDVIFERTPVVIIEYYNSNLSFLTVSDSYREYLQGAGIDDLDFVYKYVNDSSNGFKNKILETIKRCKETGTLQPVYFKTTTLSLSLTVKFVASGDGREAYAIVINSMARKATSDLSSNEPIKVTDLYGAYNRIDIIDFDSGFVRNISINKTVFDSITVDSEGLPDCCVKIIPFRLIHPNDRDAFFEFYNYETLRHKLWNSPKGYIKEYFRILEKNGEYKVKAFVLNLKNLENKEVCVSCIRDADSSDITLNDYQLITNYMYKLPVAFCVFKVLTDERDNVKDVIIDFANEKCADSFHLTTELFVGKSFKEFNGEVGEEWNEMAYKCAFENKAFQTIQYNQLLDKWLLFDLAPCGRKGYYSCTYVDVSMIYTRAAEYGAGANTNDIIIKCARILHENKGFSDALRKMLDILGQTIEADRIYYLSIKGNSIHYTMDWTSKGFESEQRFKTVVPLESISYWQKYLLKDGYVDIDDISVIKDRDPVMYSSLVSKNVRSILEIPLYADGKIVAYIGADNCTDTKDISSKTVLQSVGYFISSYLDNKELVHKFEVLGLRDTLTGVKNRTSLMKDIESLQNKDYSVGVVYADINGLKTVNDNNGHSAGDMLIKNGTKLLCMAFGKEAVYRVGGDEFVVFYKDKTKDEFTKCLNVLYKSLSDNRQVSMAIGSQWCTDASEIKFAMHEADEKMYHDKAEYYKNNKHDRRIH